MREPKYSPMQGVYIIESGEAIRCSISTRLPVSEVDKGFKYEVGYKVEGEPFERHKIVSEANIFKTLREASEELREDWEKELRTKLSKLPDNKIYIIKVDDNISFQTDRNEMIEYEVERAKEKSEQLQIIHDSLIPEPNEKDFPDATNGDMI